MYFFEQYLQIMHILDFIKINNYETISMNLTDWIGFLGVFQILLAYFLNVFEKISKNDLSFILLNLFGASMACLASVLLQYWPFIILEAIWALVSLYSLFKFKTKLD